MVVIQWQCKTCLHYRCILIKFKYYYLISNKTIFTTWFNLDIVYTRYFYDWDSQLEHLAPTRLVLRDVYILNILLDLILNSNSDKLAPTRFNRIWKKASLISLTKVYMTLIGTSLVGLLIGVSCVYIWCPFWGSTKLTRPHIPYKNNLTLSHDDQGWHQ